jgi:membrane-bound lytic murein transglycosylase D
VYRVRVGDTLEKIAKRFRISVKALKARNNLTSALIKPGDVLAIR